eukprot:SAG31_NODE_4483_length_3196_cov_36.451082_5_plen_58_part_00
MAVGRLLAAVALHLNSVASTSREHASLLVADLRDLVAMYEGAMPRIAKPGRQLLHDY